MITLLGIAIQAITEGLKFAQIREERKYTDRMVELQLDLQREEAKGVNSDDAKIEFLYRELKIIMEAARDSLTARAAVGK